MNSLVYLLVPLMVAAVVVAVIYWRDRKPTSVNEGIEQFRDGLRALAPDAGPQLPQSPTQPQSSQPVPGRTSSYSSPEVMETTPPLPSDSSAGHYRGPNSDERHEAGRPELSQERADG